MIFKVFTSRNKHRTKLVFQRASSPNPRCSHTVSEMGQRFPWRMKNFFAFHVLEHLRSWNGNGLHAGSLQDSVNTPERWHCHRLCYHLRPRRPPHDLNFWNCLDGQFLQRPGHQVLDELGIVLVVVQLRNVSGVRQRRYFRQWYTGDFSLRLKLHQDTWPFSHALEVFCPREASFATATVCCSWPLSTQQPLPPPLRSGGPFAGSHAEVRPIRV